ncbi:MAG: ATP-binding protein [Anaerolineales bacterium]|nr:ATP-binding protein [Anaerolineales bacterium]
MSQINRSLPPLTAAQQTEKMVGQQESLERIRQAIYGEGPAFRVVFVRAEGGMGKTRLLEEVLKKVDGEWGMAGDTAVSDLIDVIDIRLHARDRFIRALHNSLRRPGRTGVTFREYARALDEIMVLQAAGAHMGQMGRAVRNATQAFMDDLTEITKQRRVTWVIDTVEQLSYITSEWLLDNQLLQPDDLQGRTHQWLKDLISNADLKNVTLILAGRGKEGEMFFESMETAVSDARQKSLEREKTDISLQPLTRTETRQYFISLAQDWRERTAAGNPTAARIAGQFSWISSAENDRADVLWLYTGGIPVRLALYAQLIVEGRIIPVPLKLSFTQTLAEASIDPDELKDNKPAPSTPELRYLQWQIEDKFINLLFQDPTDRRSLILQALVRAPRGLSAEQLHYLLDNHDNVPPSEWRNNPRQLAELTTMLQGMMDLYLVKRRASWADFEVLVELEEREAATFRLGLQDEIYRIFAEHMAPQAEPQRTEIAEIWEILAEEDHSRYSRNREVEKTERKELYQKLRNWSVYRHQTFLKMKQRYMAEDESKLELQLVPDRPRTFYFEQLGTVEAQRRVAITQAIYTFEIERMVYDLLLNPERNLNESYIDLGTHRAKAGQEEIDFWAQAEMWHVTHDADNLKFVDFQERKLVREFEETMVEVLHRAVEQEDVSRWIKRFVLRGEFERAIVFAVRVEELIASFSRQTKQEKRIYHSWNHTLVRTERRVWMHYAFIYLARDMVTTLQALHEDIKQLQVLFEKTVDEEAIVRKDGHIENGFRGTDSHPHHPGYVRVRRLISQAYNVLGYGHIMLGGVQNAVRFYGRALYYIRGDKEMDSHRGVILNNLSKALSDLGRNSVSLCLDGLNLRRKLAEEVPLALSYNTLALIYDDMDRYEDAPKLAAKAIAYLRRAGARRELGLALYQLGESLRHLAIHSQRGEAAQATPDSLYAATETLLREAHTIFADINETARLIVVLIEMGSLYRDRLRSTMATSSVRQRQDEYREAMIYLERAQRMARRFNLLYLEVDAGVNIAWTHFHTGHYEEAEESIWQVEEVIDPACFITETQWPDVQEPHVADIIWALRQLSKLQMIRGQMGIARFRGIEAKLKEAHPGDENAPRRHRLLVEDEVAQLLLAETAEAYALSLGYAYAVSPGNRMLDYIIDDLYGGIRDFNPLELDAFHDYVLNLRERFTRLKSIDLLDRTLHEFFGVLEY